MLILLPPSEGKSAPRRGGRLDLASLAFAALHEPRAEVLDALVALCRSDAGDAARRLGLGPTQVEEVRRDAELSSAPTTRADRVYTGVLYQALDLTSLTGAARRRATSRLLVASGLFGVVRPGDRIPAYRLPGSASLPGLGPVARHWSRHLGPVLEEVAGGGLVVDLRSSAYAPFWRPPPHVPTATVRVLHEAGGRRTVVSHRNKATKGRLVRALLLDGATPRSPDRLAEAWRDLGWHVEHGEAPGRLDVVVADLGGVPLSPG